MRRIASKRVESATNRFLDELMDRLKLPSDYALAEVLDLTTQAIYKMRGGGAMSTTTAAKIAELLEVDPMKVIAESELERGSNPELWKRIARRVAAVAMVIGAASFGGFNNNAIASPSAPYGGSTLNLGAEYTLRNNRRRSSAFAAFVAWILGLAQGVHP